MKKKNSISKTKAATLKTGGVSFHLHCHQCGHDWDDEKRESPKMCPNCRSARYDKQTPRRTIKARKPISQSPILEQPLITESLMEEQPEKPKVKKRYTRRFYMMILGGVVAVIGLAFFALYFFTLNMVLGLPGVIMVAFGFFLFRYYWKKEDDIAIEHLGGEKKVESANSLTIYPDRVVFENVYEPQGFPMTCLNDKKKYYVNIQDPTGKSKGLMPFVLPDQQYYDPMVFAQRVLGLPAHRKLFERKPKLLQKLKTALLVLAIGIVWLLILTTTGEA